MLYIPSTIKNLELKKYKRFFTIGCSFTNYLWPTWANLLAKEIPNCYFLNQGASGAGNLYMQIQLNHLMNTMDLGPDDLVMIMWSTFYREDRYVKEQWVLPGNIFSQNVYPQEFTDKFCDVKGMTIRDMAIIDATTKLLEAQPFDSITMLASSPWNQQLQSDLDFNITELNFSYRKLQSQIMPEFYNRTQPSKYILASYIEDRHIYKDIIDYHPLPSEHAIYLKSIGIALSDEVESFAYQIDKEILAIDKISKFFTEDYLKLIGKTTKSNYNQPTKLIL